MLFRTLFTGLFAGSLAAVFTFSHGDGSLMVLFSYLSFGFLALAGMAIVTLFAPRNPLGPRTYLWSGSPAGTGPVWQSRLERMRQQSETHRTGLVFSSVRKTQN